MTGGISVCVKVSLLNNEPETGNRVTLMNRLATVTLEPLEQVVRQQLDEQINFVRLKIAGRNPVNRKPVLGFLDVIFHTAALVVEPPQVNRLPVQIGHDRFVLPIGVEYQAGLSVIDYLRFANDRHAAGLFPGCRFVNERYPFDNPVFIDKSFPVPAGCTCAARRCVLFSLPT